MFQRVRRSRNLGARSQCKLVPRWNVPHNCWVQRLCWWFCGSAGLSADLAGHGWLVEARCKRERALHRHSARIQWKPDLWQASMWFVRSCTEHNPHHQRKTSCFVLRIRRGRFDDVLRKVWAEVVHVRCSLGRNPDVWHLILKIHSILGTLRGHTENYPGPGS